MEVLISGFLNQIGVDFLEQWTDHDLKDQCKLRFDFAIKSEKGVVGIIEYQGQGHYYKIDYWKTKGSAERRLLDQQKRDQMKRDWCVSNKIKLLEVRFDDEDWKSTIKEFLNKC